MMITSFEKAYHEVQILVKTFSNNHSHFMSAGYSEAEARQDFINNFFIALGWDVNHQYQLDPYKQEVKIEKSQKQQNESARKRADYAFYKTPNYKDVHFFVEAKKPSVLLQNQPQHYFQTIKYGWNAGCPISVLTDFEEFIIIDCRSKPNIKYALNGDHKSYRYTDYADKEKFAEIYYLLSKEAVTSNSIENYASQLTKAKRVGTKTPLTLKRGAGGVVSLDDSFLEYIDSVRLTVAQSLKKADNRLDSEMLTEATQRTVDRLVFIRFLEDKLIEPVNYISEWAASGNAWKAFITDCKMLNAKYNGIVFKPIFIDKENFAGADEKLFGEICNELCSDNSPYDFNYIPIHILGSIYERFLGKVVVATAKQVRIEEKPAVRKAGGVYYTPKYIVDYIVANTIGKLIAGLTPAQIAGTKQRPGPPPLEGLGQALTFADIACGSGSFLIGVYDYLLQYHKEYYTKYPSTAQKDGCINIDGVWALSINQKQNILLNNIYGVDIDSQAVEVTQLSLFLKMLEEESLTSTMAQAKQTSMYTKVLPDLTKNIVCGNSLIGTDILNITLFPSLEGLGEAEERKLNPMDFKTTFPKVFKNGGFDAVVGNPPYVKEYTSREAFEYVKLGSLKKYYQGKMDLWYFFMCHGLDILNKNGLLGYIAPNNWVTNSGASILRNKVIKDSKLIDIIDFGSYMVFKSASIQTSIIILQNEEIDNYNFTHKKLLINNKKESEVIEFILNSNKEIGNSITPIINKEKYANTFLVFDNSKNESLLDKLKTKQNFILSSNEATNGIHPHHASVNKKMLEKHGSIFKYGEGIFVLNKKELNNLQLNKRENDLIKPFYSNTSLLKKYYINTKNEEWIIYTDSKFKNSKEIIPFPNFKRHLDRFKKVITSDNKPYGLHRSREESFFLDEKIISPRKTSSPCFCYSENTSYFSAAFYIIKTDRINLKYLTGVLNSSIIKYWLLKRGKMQGDIFQIDKEPLLEIPIFLTSNQTHHNQLVTLVEQMLATKKQLQTETLEKNINYLTNKCTSIDAQIDALVYTLYGLTAEEIRIVEGG